MEAAGGYEERSERDIAAGASEFLSHPVGLPTVLAPPALTDGLPIDDDGVQGHPFWSDRARYEVELRRARPRDLEIASRQAVVPSEPSHTADSEQASQVPSGLTGTLPDSDGRERATSNANNVEPSRERSTSPGVRAILGEMKGLLEYLVATSHEHRGRFKRSRKGRAIGLWLVKLGVSVILFPREELPLLRGMIQFLTRVGRAVNSFTLGMDSVKKGSGTWEKEIRGTLFPKRRLPLGEA